MGRGTVFHFKDFSIAQDRALMKVGTDGVLLGAWVEPGRAQTILDIGTGTGLIAGMLAQRTTDASITGIEIDEGSARQAAENMAATPWSERIRIVHISLQDFADTSDLSFDLIVSNPPFFTGGIQSPDPGRNSVRHTVSLSHTQLLETAVRLLRQETGRLALILPHTEGNALIALARRYDLYVQRCTRVHPTKQLPAHRLLLELGGIPTDDAVPEELVIQEGGRNEWTSAYSKLTEQFYLDRKKKGKEPADPFPLP